MRIDLHIGLEQASSQRLQSVLADKRDQLIGKGVLFSRVAGNKNHTRLYLAVTDPDHVDPLRFNRGFISPAKQSALYQEVAKGLAQEITKHTPETLILSCSQLGKGLHRASELERLKALLAPFSDDIRIIAHVSEPAEALLRHYGEQILEGRGQTLNLEMGLTDADNWWDAALEQTPDIDPGKGIFAETQGPAFWLDYPGLVSFWEDTFGPGSVHLRSFDEAVFVDEMFTKEIRETFDIEENIGKAKPHRFAPLAPAAALARGRQLNHLLLQVLSKGVHILPRTLWNSLVQEVAVPGPAHDPASLSKISKCLEKGNKSLLKTHPGLHEDTFKRPRAKKDWEEADPINGFRASQYLLGSLWRIEKATQEELAAKAEQIDNLGDDTTAASALSDTARKLMPPLAVRNFEQLRGSPFAPHNSLGAVNEEELAAAYTAIKPRELPKGNTGNVIVGCMKNEAPYILEWIAYHRAIGIDNFLIYTNGCDDGTDEILGRLHKMGILKHRNNDDWKGNSPQQFALNQSLKEPVIKNAEWIIHIDVDEFMNVRTGNGTLQDFFKAVPNATNVAMTWRMFGHNDVTKLADEFVIDQFDACAPKFCPKPHTSWGFKTMFKNIGAYEKISCHRPNKLDEAFVGKVKWVNGSGQDMTADVAENGWRSSKKTIGYDLLQLNHYALRSAESFLIKRQRGRALHVDRSIGINYWIRMDWSNFRDITIKRNIPRVRAEFDRLMEDKNLRQYHEEGLEWHRAKVAELHENPEFADLYKQALEIKLTETERVAYALALDMEN